MPRQWTREDEIQMQIVNLLQLTQDVGIKDKDLFDRLEASPATITGWRQGVVMPRRGEWVLSNLIDIVNERMRLLNELWGECSDDYKELTGGRDIYV